MARKEAEVLIGDKEIPTAEKPFVFSLFLQSRDFEKSAIVLVEIYEPRGASNPRKEVSPVYSNIAESKEKILEATQEVLNELQERYKKGHERHKIAKAFAKETMEKMKTFFSEN